MATAMLNCKKKKDNKQTHFVFVKIIINSTFYMVKCYIRVRNYLHVCTSIYSVHIYISVFFKIFFMFVFLSFSFSSYLSQFISTYQSFLGHFRGCPRDVMVKAMDCRIIVHEFVLQSRYYIHFRANTLGKGMNPPYPPRYGLNSTTTVLLGE